MDISLAINPFMHPIVGSGGASWTSGGITCSDTEATATDSAGENCSWYFTSPTTCTNNDDGDFVAANMCCRCGGGESTPGSSVCTDLDIQAGVVAKTDSQSNACSWYDSNLDSCGKYDDTDFIASELCCSCAGTYVDQSGVSDGRCIDGDTSGQQGSNSLGCSWYETGANQAFCHTFNDVDFTARDLCCKCNGGTQVCKHTNNVATDKDSNTCEYYTSSTICANYEKANTGTFDSRRMCCKCGGGDQCRDSNGNLKDKLNNDCDYYDANPTKCGINDSATFTASEMCCACFQGTIRPTTAAQHSNFNLPACETATCTWHTDYDDFVALIPATDPSLGEKFYSYIDLTEWWEEGTGLENLLSIKPQLYNENKVSLDQPNFDAWIITDASLRIIYKDNVSNTNYKIDRITYEFLIKAPTSWEPYGYEKTAMMIRFAATMTGITGTPKSYVSTSNINPYLDFDAVNGIIGQGTTYTFDVPCPCEEKKSAAMRQYEAIQQVYQIIKEVSIVGASLILFVVFFIMPL